MSSCQFGSKYMLGTLFGNIDGRRGRCVEDRRVSFAGSLITEEDFTDWRYIEFVERGDLIPYGACGPGVPARLIRRPQLRGVRPRCQRAVTTAPGPGSS